MSQVSQLLIRDYARGLRLLAVVATLCALWVPFFYFLYRGAQPIDQISPAAAVPMVVSYIMVRAVMRFADEPMSEETQCQKENGELLKQHSFRSHAMATLFVVSLWIMITAVASMGVYWALGMHWAITASWNLVRVIAAVNAGTAVVLCLTPICKPAVVRIAGIFHQVFNHPLPSPMRINRA